MLSDFLGRFFSSVRGKGTLAKVPYCSSCTGCLRTGLTKVRTHAVPILYQSLLSSAMPLLYKCRDLEHCEAQSGLHEFLSNMVFQHSLLQIYKLQSFISPKYLGLLQLCCTSEMFSSGTWMRCSHDIHCSRLFLIKWEQQLVFWVYSQVWIPPYGLQMVSHDCKPDVLLLVMG